MVQGFSMLLKTKRHGREGYFSSYSPCPMMSVYKEDLCNYKGGVCKISL